MLKPLPQKYISSLRFAVIKKKVLPFSVETRGNFEVFANGAREAGSCQEGEEDWRKPIISFPGKNGADYQTWLRATKYVLMNLVLDCRGAKDDLYLRCPSKEEALIIMAEVHEGICGAHQAGVKMRLLIRRHAYYWPTILADCIEYAKRCKACQKHGPIQHVPAVPLPLHPIVKPWPFRGWAMDLIGQIFPPSSKGYCDIIVATDYFTKLAEAVPLREVKK